MQIGIRDLNNAFDSKFKLHDSSKLLRFLHVLQEALKHPIDCIYFMSSEDYDGMTKNEQTYMKWQKVGVNLDVREYKYKSFNCSSCKTKIN